jgi:hypothetical protein
LENVVNLYGRKPAEIVILNKNDLGKRSVASSVEVIGSLQKVTNEGDSLNRPAPADKTEVNLSVGLTTARDEGQEAHGDQSDDDIKSSESFLTQSNNDENGHEEEKAQVGNILSENILNNNLGEQIHKENEDMPGDTLSKLRKLKEDMEKAIQALSVTYLGNLLNKDFQCEIICLTVYVLDKDKKIGNYLVLMI